MFYFYFLFALKYLTHVFKAFFPPHFISRQSHPLYYIKIFEKQCNKNTSPPVTLTIMWKNCIIAVGVHKFQTFKFYTLVPNILSIIIAVFFSLAFKNLYQVTCTEQKVPDSSDIHKSLQNCGSSLWNLLYVYVTCLPPRIWRWFLQFSKSCALLQSTLFHCAFCCYGTYSNVSGSRRRCCRYLAIAYKFMMRYMLKGGLRQIKEARGLCLIYVSQQWNFGCTVAIIFSVCTLSNFRVLPPAWVDFLNTSVTGNELRLLVHIITLFVLMTSHCDIQAKNRGKGAVIHNYI